MGLSTVSFFEYISPDAMYKFMFPLKNKHEFRSARRNFPRHFLSQRFLTATHGIKCSTEWDDICKVGRCEDGF